MTLQAAVRDTFGGVADITDQQKASAPPGQLHPGDNEIPLSLPLLAAGTHFCDLWLKSDKGVEQFGSFAFSVTNRDTIDALTFDTPFHQLGDAAADVTAHFAAPLSQAAELKVSATDTYGREIARETGNVAAGAQEAKVRLPLNLTVALAQWVRVELSRGTALSAKQALLIVRRSAPAEYPSLLWGGIEGGLDGLHHLRRQREAGFNVAYVGPAADGSAARFAALADMQFASYATRVTGISDGKDGKVTNAAAMKKWVDEVVENHRASAPYGLFMYSLGDECSLGGADQALGPNDVAAYRDYLKEQYGTIAELNRVWQTHYADFTDIQPVDWGKAAAPEQYPQKHDRLGFIEHLYARTMHELTAGIKEMDPHAMVGAEGSEPGDLEDTLSGLTMWGPYSDRRIDVLLASLAPRSLIRGMWWGGYHGGTLDRPSSVNYFWRQVFEGVCNTNFFFDGIIGHHESNTASDLSWADYFAKMMPSLRELYETPAPLISAAADKDFGVALLWSQPSEHAGLFYAPYSPPGQEMLAQFAALDAVGVNYHFVTARQLEAHGLNPKTVRVLLLPMTTAVSPRLAEALAQYVADGGVLFADGSAGLMDGHCALLPSGALDALFGVKRAGAPKVAGLGLQGAGTLLGKPLAFHLAGAKVDTALRADGAEVVMAAGEVPLLTLRRQGKGVAVFLNSSIGEQTGRGEEGLAAAESLLSALLAAADVHPLCSVAPLGAVRVYSHSLGKITLLSAVLNNSDTPATIHLAEKAWVYDCLSRKALGKTDSITLPADPRRFALYALSAEELKAPGLTAGRARRGKPLQLTIDVPAAPPASCAWTPTARTAPGCASTASSSP